MNIDNVGEFGIKPPVRAVVASKVDNVAVLLSHVKAGDTLILNGGNYQIARYDAPVGYKIALKVLEEGTQIINFGKVIGVALRQIAPGEPVHYHNLRSA